MTRYNAHQGPWVAAAAVVLPLATAAVGLRFYVRLSSRSKLQWDDWWAFISLIFFYGVQVCNLWGSQLGADYNYFLLPLSVVQDLLKTVYVAVIFVPLCMTAAKLSILCLYNRIFSASARFRFWVRVMAGIQIAWCIAAVVSVVWTCTPIKKAWDPLTPGHCINFRLFTLLIETPNSLLDFIIMAMPMSMLRGMNMGIASKISLAVVFLLGSFVGIVGFVRIGITYHPKHYSKSTSGHWVVIQLTCAIICCCLPTYRSVLGRTVSVLGVWCSSALKSVLSSRFFATSQVSSKSRPQPGDIVVTMSRKQCYKSFDSPDKSVNDEVWCLAEAKGGNASSVHALEDRDAPSLNSQETA